jgi:type II secretory pathway pseudopilin PulG
MPQQYLFRRCSGFTYVGLLFFVAIMSLTLAMASTLWSFLQQREKERDLLFVGGQFRRAIQMYYEHTPGTVKRYPQNLEALLEDNRFLTRQRYLRRIYSDPITGKREWETVKAPDGGVMGVYSKSEKPSIKSSNFRLIDLALEGQQRYSEWKFVYQPPVSGIAKNTRN